MKSSERNIVFLCIGILFVVALTVRIVLADTDDLDVTSCETTSCTASQLNTNDTNGPSINKNGVIQPVMDDLPGDADSINSIVLSVRYDEGVDTNGNNVFQLQSDSGNTQYGSCQWTDSQAASGTEHKSWNATSCHSWTVAAVNDLQVYYQNQDSGKAGSVQLEHVEVDVNYDVSAGDPCTVTCGGSTSADLDCSGQSFTITGSGDYQIAHRVHAASLNYSNTCDIIITSGTSSYLAIEN